MRCLATVFWVLQNMGKWLLQKYMGKYGYLGITSQAPATTMRTKSRLQQM